MGQVQALRLFFILFLCIFLFPLVSAVDTYQVNQDLDIKHPVRIDGAVPTGVGCNITVIHPNDSILIDFQEMTDNSNYFNYTINGTNLTTKGLYNYDITCSNGTISNTEGFQFFLNQGGIEPSESRTGALTRTIFIFLILAGVSFFVSYHSKRMPVKVSLFLLMIWFILMAINFSFISLQDEVVNIALEEFMEFFVVIGFQAHWFILLSIAIIWIVTFFVNFKENIQLKKNKRYGI